MINVISCITLEHDLRLVALAAFICLAGGLTLIQLVRRAYQVKGRARIAWAAISSIALTVSVWCTHFISMLAFDAGVPVTIDPVLTMLSLLLPTFGFFIAICLNISKPTQLNAVLGNTLMGLCIATLHYVGMMAYRVDGLVSWKLEYIAASVALVCAFSILSGFAFLRYKESRFNIPATLLFAAGVVSVHFTGMEAMQIYPLQLSDAPMDAATFQALSIATAIGGILVIGLGLASFFLDHDTRQDNYQQLLKMAMTDSLTGLPNRNAFIEDLDRKIEKAHGLNKKLTVIVIDLNRFKEINDMYGHRAGDEVLSTLATSLIGELSADINIARMGGDEFAASVVYDKTATLDAFIARLESALNIQAMFEETLITTSGSFGVAKFPTDGQSSDELRNNADLAMYRAKLHPSRKVCFYEPSMDAEIRQKREIANALSHAMEHDQLELHYQLQASVQSGKVCGMEALLRWTHPTMGPVSPAVFIPIAEEYNLIIALDTEEMLSALGVKTIDLASNMATADRLISKKKFSIVCLDINLGGEESFPLAERLSKTNTPHIFTTGFGAAGLPDQYETNAPILKKPYRLEDLKHAIARACSETLGQYR